MSNKFDTSTLSITLSGLANQSVADSAVFDNTNTAYEDVQVFVKFTTGSGFNSNPKLYIGILPSYDGISFVNWLKEDNILQTIQQTLSNVPLHENALYRVVSSIKKDYGCIPPYFKIRVRNDTGTTLSSSTGGFGLTLLGINDYARAPSGFSSGQVSITNSPVSILASNALRQGLVLSNNGPNTVYISSTTGATTGGGFPLLGHSTVSINPEPFSQQLYGIASTTGSVGYMEW